MNKYVTLSIDVVIPVYNAPKSTQRCIDSVITHLSSSIGMVFIHNDASNETTREMLDRLSHQQIHKYHAPQNQGYGRSVNEAVARSQADLVLVLNSDIEFNENFLPCLLHALEADPELAVINPAQDQVVRYEAKRYLRRPGGYIVTYRFKGYAFLIRRDVFLAMGGFDSKFGRGYFEDTDLGRRLIQKGWRMGVHPDVSVRHESGASFGRGRSYRLLVKKNRRLYLSNYPDAQQNVLMVSGHYTLADLSTDQANSIEHVLRQGGSVHWLTPSPLLQLPCLQLRNSRLSAEVILKLMLRGQSREDKRFSAIWILPGVSWWLRVLLKTWVLWRHLVIQEWEINSPELANLPIENQK